MKYRTLISGNSFEQYLPHRDRVTLKSDFSKHFLLVLLLFLAARASADAVTVISNVKPSIVIVGTFNATNSPRFNLRGTGFVAGNGNWVVTNAHVIPDGAEADLESKLVVQVRVDSKVQAGQSELAMRQATVLEVDKLHDLALLQFDGAPVPKLILRDSDTVREGQSIAFMGFPIGGALGFSPVTHRGMVSSITPIALPSATAQQLNARTIASLRSGSFNIFQLDATAYPGNSGGPMFDAETGDVLGVINMVFVKGTKESALTNPSGISYAIPSRFVQQLMQRRKAE
jgi:serine protease Do